MLYVIMLIHICLDSFFRFSISFFLDIFITSAKVGSDNGFTVAVCVSLCLSVCLFECLQDYSNSCRRILMNFFWRTGYVNSTSWLDLVMIQITVQTQEFVIAAG